MLAVTVSTVNAQVIGETDAISIPDFRFRVNLSSNSTGRSLSIFNTEYDEGYYAGYEMGWEDGLNDANSCGKWLSPYGFVQIYDPYTGLPVLGFDYQNGHYDGWLDAYEDAFDSRIAEKAAACPTDYTFNDIFCTCECVKKDFYYDGDGDGYYDITTYKYECFSDDSRWKPLSDLYGIDCDDSNPNIWKYNDCGLCSAEDGLTDWYYDYDGDGYYGQTIASCSKPITGTLSSWSTNTLGEDCDDDDLLANIEKTWYYFNDEDSYYGETQMSCLRPSAYDASNWRIDEGSGWDCNDDDSNVYGPITWYYDNDGDGYHGQSETVCQKPTTGVERKWTKQSLGSDCDDDKKSIYIENECGICGTSTAVIAYLDIDGDGYHSVVINDLCANNLYPVQMNGYVISNSPALQTLAGMEPAIEYDYNERTHYGYPDRPHYFFNGTTLRKEEECETSERNWSGTFCFNWYYDQIYYLSIRDENGDKKKIFGQGGDFIFLNPEEPRERTHPLGYNYFISETLGLDCDDLDESQKSHGDWYFDGDGDGFYDQNTTPRVSTCAPPNDQWILFANSSGPDCDDTDPTATEQITWYFDGDDDNYYGGTVQTCENPGLGTAQEEYWRTGPGAGADCDDDDQEATLADRAWYYDQDGDGYFGSQTTSCHNPASGTNEAKKWKTDPGLGEDCNDNDETKQTENTCGKCGGTEDPIDYYVDLDGDGYHSVYKNSDCGAPIFSYEHINAGNFPEELMPGLIAEQIEIPGTGETFGYLSGVFIFPESVLTDTSLGLDCDDLDPAILADGDWYPDVDGDGYHEPTTPVKTCSPPDRDTYILLANSLGEDCNDQNYLISEAIDWYWDEDGDGYYTDRQLLCHDPGMGWNRSSNLGPDIDDADPYTPAMTPPGHVENFVIASLLKTEYNDQGEEVIYYGGEYYAREDIKLVYRGVEFSYDDLLFEGASPLTRMQPDKLLIGDKAVVVGAEMVVNEEATGSSSEDNSESSSTRTITIDGFEFDDLTAWQQFIFDGTKGYANVPGDISAKFPTAGFSVDVNNYIFQPAADLEAIKTHYSTAQHSLPFTLQLRRFEGTWSDGHEEYLLDDEVIIGTDIPAVIISMIGRPDKRLEYVVSIHDDSFKATVEELQSIKFKDENGQFQNKWVDEAGNWIDPDQSELYDVQLAELKKFRQLMVNLMARDYESTVTTTPQPSSITGLEQEVYPDYADAEFGLFSKWADYLSLGYHLGHQFKMPAGSWNDEILSGSESWNKWQTKSPASVAGIIDGGLTDVDQIAESIKLAQALRHSKARLDVLNVVDQFNVGEQMQKFTYAPDSDLIDDGGIMADPIAGAETETVQTRYYNLGKQYGAIVDQIHDVWSQVGKSSKQITSFSFGHPAASFDQDMLDFSGTFENSINKFDEFGAQSEAHQEQLIIDLAMSEADELGVAMASNSVLIDPWNILYEAQVAQEIRMDPKMLEAYLLDAAHYWVDWEEDNIDIYPGWVDESGDITYLTPAGKPFKLPERAEPSFTGLIKDVDGNIVDISLTRGVLMAFRLEGVIHVASFIPWDDQYFFQGYKRLGTKDEFKEISTSEKLHHNIVVGEEDIACRLYILTARYDYRLTDKAKYRGDGFIVTARLGYYDDVKNEDHQISLTACVPDYWTWLEAVDTEEFENTVYAKYNYYGRGGLLQKTSSGVFFYSQLDTDGDLVYFQYTGDRWTYWPDPTDTECKLCPDEEQIEEVHALWQALAFLREFGHVVLDVGGVIPVAGEAFDVVNGIWYAAEGDLENAVFAFASTAPVIGWASVGGKYVLNGVSKIGKIVREGGQYILKYEDEVDLLTKKINDLEFDDLMVSRLQIDINDSEELFELMLNDLNLVDAWKVISNSPNRTDIDFLKFFDNADVVNARKVVDEANIKSKFPDMSVEELTSVYHYTTDAYYDLNRALRGLDPMTEQFDAFNKALNKSMDKLPKYSQPVYRGSVLDESILAKYKNAFDKKVDVIEDGFMSTSKDFDVAKSFADDVVQSGQKKVFFKIEGKNGVDIEDISAYGPSFNPDFSESEILFKSGSKFKVTEYLEKTLPNGDPYISIKLVE